MIDILLQKYCCCHLPSIGNYSFSFIQCTERKKPSQLAEPNALSILSHEKCPLDVINVHNMEWKKILSCKLMSSYR